MSGRSLVPKLYIHLKGGVPFVLSFLLLTACAKTIDTNKIADTIQQDVIRRGGISLKSVTCPSKVEPEAEKTFECIGEIDSGYTFTIPVKQQDGQGHVVWDVPHAKGLLNLAKFETSIQEALQTEVGSRPVVDCGDGFKAVKAGQIFACKLEVKAKSGNANSSQVAKKSTNPTPAQGSPTITAKPAQPDKIIVSVGADGNVSWQRVIPGAMSQLLPQPSPKPTKGTAGVDGQAPSDKSSQVNASPTQPAPPAQKSAEDFLNQPGASSQFED